MASDMQRIEIGFTGGQVVSLRLEEKRLGELRKAVEQDEGWHDLEIEDGTISLDLGTVVFVRTSAAPHTIGFSGD
jgi:hypothetical protein